jgi:hypothetical protein
MIRSIEINKARRLPHVNLLIQKTMKKGILNVELTKVPAVRERAIPSNNRMVAGFTTGLKVSS